MKFEILASAQFQFNSKLKWAEMRTLSPRSLILFVRSVFWGLARALLTPGNRASSGLLWLQGLAPLRSTTGASRRP